MGIQNAVFDYTNMKNPYQGKDIKFDFKTGDYKGKDKDYQLDPIDKVKFDKYT